MALPTSGPLSISAIRTELGSSSGSLRTLSAAAGKSTPDSISEFYGYSAFNPRDYFDVRSGTGNGGTYTFSGLNFQPHNAVSLSMGQQNTTVFHDLDFNKNVTYYDINGLNLMNETSDGATLGSYPYEPSRTNQLGRELGAAFFNTNQTATQAATAGNVNYRFNQDAGFGFMRWDGLGNIPDYFNHQLTQKPHFVITRSQLPFANVFYTSSVYDDPAVWPGYAKAIRYSWDKLSVFYDDSYFHNMTWKSANNSTLYWNRNETYGQPYFSVSQGWSFYAHPVNNFSYTGLINWTADSQVQSVNIGARAKFVLLIATAATASGPYNIYIKIDGMTDWKTGSLSREGGREARTIKIQTTATGFQVENEFYGELANGRLTRAFYYAII